MRDDAAPTTPLRVAVSGASGLIGSTLGASLTSRRHRVLRLVRRPARSADEIAWDPPAGTIDAAALEGLDAVVHLSGARIDRRWTRRRKQEIVRSRVVTGRLLAETIAGLDRPPRVLVSSSAIGYYGSRGDEILTEESGPGSDFLAEVCVQWEEACEPARAADVRVVSLRTGLTLASLGQLIRVARLGLGGRLADGQAWWSWVSLDDVVGAYHHAIVTEELSGPVNVVSPEPVRNAVFTETLGGVLHRPTVLPVPAAVIRLVFGELGETALLASQRVSPGKLEASGFRFLHPDLESALRHELER